MLTDWQWRDLMADYVAALGLGASAQQSDLRAQIDADRAEMQRQLAEAQTLAAKAGEDARAWHEAVARFGCDTCEHPDLERQLAAAQEARQKAEVTLRDAGRDARQCVADFAAEVWMWRARAEKAEADYARVLADSAVLGEAVEAAQWEGRFNGEHACPVCRAIEGEEHEPTCAIGQALAAPNLGAALMEDARAQHEALRDLKAYLEVQLAGLRLSDHDPRMYKRLEQQLREADAALARGQRWGWGQRGEGESK